MDLTRILVDPSTKETNKEADDWVKYLADLMWSRHVSPVRFMIEPDEGLYVIMPNSLKALYPQLKHTYNFDLLNYIETTDSDFWLCVYDQDKKGNYMQHTIKYTRKPVTQ